MTENLLICSAREEVFRAYIVGGAEKRRKIFLEQPKEQYFGVKELRESYEGLEAQKRKDGERDFDESGIVPRESLFFQEDA